MCVLSAAGLVFGCDGNSVRTTQPDSIAQVLEAPAYNFRLGDSVLINLSDHAGFIESYTVTPDLPQGLILNRQTGVISGVASVLSHTAQYQVIAGVSFELGLHPALPETLEFLDHRYSAEVVIANAAAPVRMAASPDGRLFYAELQSGNIRIIDRNQRLLREPFASLSIESGKEKGLLGLALDPDFQTNGYVYAYATVAGHNGTESHAEIVRFTAVQNSAVDKTVIVDLLPIADIHNGGDLVFDKSGHLFVGRGDVDDPASSQVESGLSGRILRYTRDGNIPADNPYPGTAEWSRGIRNTFAMALQPETGDLFGADAGPASDDKLNYLQAGKNFVWGMQEEPRGSGIGFTLRLWEEVITPTALFFHSGAGISSFANQLFLSSYNEENIRRIELAGDRYTDFIREVEFATFNSDGASNKPLDLIEGAEGSIFVSTFNAIYRLYLH